MSEKNPSLSCFFPCYNDAYTIGSLVAAADTVAAEYTDDYEIIVIDDGSTDSSREMLRELQHKYSKLRLIFHEKNRGYGGALQSGFEGATRDLIFYTDGDGQYDVFELRKLLRVMQEGVDVVNGYKLERSDPLHRIVIGKIYLNLMRVLFNFKVRDVDCDFRLMRREIFDSISLHHTSGVICIEMVKKMEMAGYRFVDFPVNHYHRIHGKSQFFNFRRLFRTGINILKLWVEIVGRPALSRRVVSKDRAEVK
ncbi:MAG: glycosyltransferase family 2 protein [bacterium]|nr:glycosyltransferase family 2 protein [bacterium]